MATQTQLGKLLIAREARQKRLNSLSVEARKLENEISQMDARIFSVEHDLSPKWEEVPMDQWEHFKVGEEAAVVIQRPKNTESWTGEGTVDSYGGWSRGIMCGFTHMSFIDSVGKPIMASPGTTIKIWRRND